MLEKSRIALGSSQVVRRDNYSPIICPAESTWADRRWPTDCSCSQTYSSSSSLLLSSRPLRLSRCVVPRSFSAQLFQSLLTALCRLVVEPLPQPVLKRLCTFRKRRACVSLSCQHLRSPEELPIRPPTGIPLLHSCLLTQALLHSTALETERSQHSSACSRLAGRAPIPPWQWSKRTRHSTQPLDRREAGSAREALVSGRRSKQSWMLRF